MSLVLTDKARELLADQPPYLADEPTNQRMIQAFANELERAATTLEEIRSGLTPQSAHDTYRGLSMLEDMLELPVAPAGETETARRQKVLAYVGARRAATGEAWVELMSLAFGNTPWSYFEGPADFTITIKFPYASGSFTAGQVLAFARAITPAHIDIVAAFDEGFLVGISQVEIEPL